MKLPNFCSFWPDMCMGYDYSACCQKHDEDYADPTVHRLPADNALFKCVARESNVLMAATMWVGVRCFGWAFKTWVPVSKEKDTNATNTD